MQRDHPQTLDVGASQVHSPHLSLQQLEKVLIQGVSKDGERLQVDDMRLITHGTVLMEPNTISLMSHCSEL